MTPHPPPRRYSDRDVIARAAARLAGDPNPVLVDMIASRIVVSEIGCWVFTGCIVPSGYGQINTLNKRRYTHRVMYEALVGPVPDGLELDHLCRVKACCRPSHLEPVPRGENIRRYRRSLPACPNGHRWTPETERFLPQGWRYCRECNRLRAAANRARRRALA